MTDPIMDAGAWRARALRAEAALDGAEFLADADQAEIRALSRELADLRAEREALYAVVRAARDLMDGHTVRRWKAVRHALDALPCWCGKPDGHASVCPKEER